jgi:hypothetical protein
MLTLVPAMAVTVVGSTSREKSWVGSTMKWPVEVAVPPPVVMEIGPVVAPEGTVTVSVVVVETEKLEAEVPLKVTD